MRLQTYRALLLILSTLLSISLADFLAEYNSSLSLPYRSEPKLNKRVSGTCRTRCSVKTCCQLPSSSDAPIDDPDDSTVTSRSLLARTLFPVDSTDLDAVDTQIVQRFTDKKVSLIYTGSDGTGDSTSNWKPITSRSPAWDMGLSALCGCTTLIVASQNGVYGAHFFEDVAWGDEGDSGGFQTQVVDFLKSTTGVAGKSGGHGSFSLAQVNARLTRGNAGVAAYILAPTAELPDDNPNAPGYITGTPMYEDQLNQLIQLLPEIIPGLEGHIETVLYEALEGGQTESGEDINPQHAELLDDHSRGRVLAQYDPQNSGQRTVRLFFETRLVFERQLGAST
ncbi:hypothetical protein ACMFMG_005453 [Clarireedia jacksonii]